MKRPMQKTLMALTTAALIGGVATAQADGKLNIYN